MNLNSNDLMDFTKVKGLLIDVRSPEEYYKGHLPYSFNIPLFNNDERASVGESYKKSGREKAVLKGLAIVEKKLEQLISDLITTQKNYLKINKSQKNISKNIKIYCARGGMRSQSVSWLLQKLNYSTVTLKGGYKSYRNWVLSSFISSFIS